MADASPELRILAAIRAVPRGEVAGYGHIARRAGLPGRARLVARVLAHHDDPELPWHRILRSDGRIAFAEGTRGWREQSQRLRAEGVRVERGRVKMPAPEAALDALLWGGLMDPPPAPKRAAPKPKKVAAKKTKRPSAAKATPKAVPRDDRAAARPAKPRQRPAR
jgi:methylated-DNA-protein-cysteine methyltransferase-like protein